MATRNIVRNNQISDSAGYTIKIQNDGDEYDKGGNVVENNRLSGSAGATFKIKSDATQGRFCGNNVAAAGTMFNSNGEDTLGESPPPADPAGHAMRRTRSITRGPLSSTRSSTRPANSTRCAAFRCASRSSALSQFS